MRFIELLSYPEFRDCCDNPFALFWELSSKVGNQAKERVLYNYRWAIDIYNAPDHVSYVLDFIIGNGWGKKAPAEWTFCDGLANAIWRIPFAITAGANCFHDHVPLAMMSFRNAAGMNIWTTLL
jgi:hypothetical protein